MTMRQFLTTQHFVSICWAAEAAGHTISDLLFVLPHLSPQDLSYAAVT